MKTTLTRWLPKALIDDFGMWLQWRGVPEWYDRDVAVEILWRIQNRRSAYISDSPERPRGLSSATLRRISRDYLPHIELLSAAGIISRSSSYCPGEYSRECRMASHFYEREPEPVMVTNRRLITRILSMQRERSIRQPQGARDRRRLLDHLKIDRVAAEAWRAENRDPDSGEDFSTRVNFARIEAQDFYLHKDYTGREHTNITGLPKEVRARYITWAGESPAEIDTPTSQPRFLYRYLLEQCVPQNELRKLAEYLNRDIYLVFCEHWQVEHGEVISRDDMKVKVMTYLYDRPRAQPSRFAIIFSREFPAIARHIEDLQRRDNGGRALAIHMMQQEANFIFRFCAGLTVPYFTIHDCVGVRASDYEIVQEKFTHALRMEGLLDI